MSIVLDRILAQSVTMYPATVSLSPESVTVLLYAVQFLEKRRNWLDLEDDPMDEITDADWDEIEKLTANLVEEVYTPMIGYCFPVVLGGIPDNCLALDGSTHAREDYPLLYDLLDDIFVLDSDTFYLPDFRSRVPIGAGEGSGLSEYTVGQIGGEENHVLTVSELATHSHTDSGHAHSEITAVPSSTLPGEIPLPVPTAIPGIASTGVGFASIQNTGDSSPHNNLQPFIGIMWAVVAL